jgi:hypothetical protein
MVNKLTMPFQESSEPFATLNRAFALRVLADRRKEQDVALALMISLVMIMLYILIEGATQGCFSKQNHPPETLLLDGSDPPLRVGIQVWRSGWQDDTLDTGIINDVLKRGTELGVAVMDEILTGCQEAPFLHGHLACHLDHPRLIGMRRDARHVDLSTPKMHEKQDIVRYQPTQRPDLGGEEVGGHEDGQMRADALFPRGGALTLWRWRETMTLGDVAHCLVTHRVAQVRQGPYDAVITPRTIVLGYTHNQCFQSQSNFGAAWGLPLCGAVKLLGDQFTVPAENGLRFDDGSDFLSSLLPQLLADLGQGLALAVTQSDAPCDLGAQDAILRHQVLVAQQ